VKIDQRFSFYNWIPILIFKSVSVFYLRIAIMIAIEKLIRIDQGSIFVLQSIPVLDLM